MVRLTAAREGFLASPGWGETARAFVVFGLLLSALGWATHRAAFQGMSRVARNYRLAGATEEARRIAEAVTSYGRSPGGMDFYRVRQNRKPLETFLSERLAGHPDLLSVVVCDRFGTPVASAEAQPARSDGGTVLASAPLMLGGIPQGEVRVGIAAAAFDKDIAKIERSLRIQVALFAAAGFVLLAVGFVYVIHLARKNRALEQARLSAERVAYRGLLASGLAHEIRNPLNAMNMNLQMLEEEMQGIPGAGDGDTLELLASTKSEIKRLERLVNNFLLYARPSAPKFEKVDLNELLKAIALFLHADFRQTGVELALDLEPLLPSVEIDESQFRQAIMNILVNARQVMKQGGTVALVSRAGSGGDVLVEIRDQGPGIPPENLDKIFEPFFSKRAGGTGLGLAIARQMVEAHGGRIDLDSEVGRGTTFRIRLPRRHGRLEPADGAKA